MAETETDWVPLLRSPFLTTTGIIVASTLGLVLVRMNASSIYDLVIFKMTSLWYKAVIGRISSACILDIGIGNATSCLAHADLLKEKSITVKVSFLSFLILFSLLSPFPSPLPPPPYQTGRRLHSALRRCRSG